MNTLSLHQRPAIPSIDHRSLFETFRRQLLRAPTRDVMLAALIFLAASVVVYAEQHIQDWIPDVLTFPEDTEVLTDRAIGSTIRLFSISTETDVDVLLSDWEQSLSDNGYPVTQEAGDLLDRIVEFTGPGIRNAKIIVAPSKADGRSVIEFDATLN